MSTLAAARQAVAEKVAAEGFTVALDPRNVTPPCVLVGRFRRGQATGHCLLEAELPVTIVAPGPGNGDAEVWLADALETLMAAIDADTFDAGDSNILSAIQTLPSYTMYVLINNGDRA